MYPLTGILGVAFIVLKLCGVIAWSWWWVLAPFWGGFALYMVIVPFALVMATPTRKSRFR